VKQNKYKQMLKNFSESLKLSSPEENGVKPNRACSLVEHGNLGTRAESVNEPMHQA
jgi:hypothetical protein